MIRHLENRLRECLQNFETLEKSIQFTKVCEDASFWKGVSVGMCYKTVADVDDGFGDRTPACREYTHPRADSDSRIYAAIPGRTFIRPVIQVHILQFLGTHGIESQIPSTTTPKRTSWVEICRGKNRCVDGLLSEIQDTIPRVLNYFWKDLLQKKANLVPHRWSNPASRKVMRRSSKFRRIQCTIPQKLFLLEKGSGMTFLSSSLSKETLFKQTSQNWSWGWYVILIKMNEKLKAPFIGISWVQNCDKRFRSAEGENPRTRIRFNTIVQEAARWGSSIAWIPKKLVVYSCHSRTHRWESHSAWVWWVTSPFHINGKNSCYIEDFLLMSLLSSNQDSSLADEKAEKEDRPSSSHLSTRLGTIQTKKNLAMTYLNREKYTITVSGKYSGCRLLDQFSMSTRQKNYESGRQGLRP